MNRHNFYLTEQQMKALKALSQATGMSMSEHMRRAVDSYLQHQPPAIRTEERRHYGAIGTNAETDA